MIHFVPCDVIETCSTVNFEVEAVHDLFENLSNFVIEELLSLPTESHFLAQIIFKFPNLSKILVLLEHVWNN